MDSRILDTLRNASNLDLYELSLALNQMLSDPVRIVEVRRHLHTGAQVLYFNHQRGTMAEGRVIQLQATRAIVQDLQTQVQWTLSYPAIVAKNIPGAASQPKQEEIPARPKPDLSNFNLGDTVSFTDKHLREHIGKITRINSKTCSVLCDGQSWRVSPVFLNKIIDL